MSRHSFRLIFFLAICSIPLPRTLAAEADVVYVTDELRLGLYRTEETSGRALKTLVSGARLEVLERSLMSIQVRTEDGDEGWVKTAYIVTSEPARRRLATVETLQSETAARLADREAELSALKSDHDALVAELTLTRQGVTDLPGLRAENENLKAALNEGGIRVPLLWIFIASMLSLLLGGLLGYWLLDRRVRRRFGGIRVY